MWKNIATLLILAVMLSSCGSEKVTIERSVKNNVYLEGENIGGQKESNVLQKLKTHASKIDLMPQNAVLDQKNWTLVAKEKTGRRVNVQRTVENLLNSGEGQQLKLIVEEVQPEVRAQELVDNVIEIGVYSTPLLDRKESRINNIRLAAQKIDYKKLAPGEEFSFNGVVGKRTEAKGYEEAPIIIKTEEGSKKGYGVGGGICQVASTLYNVVEKCGLEITERHLHSKDVGYVPKGQDATVAYGSVDFKFRNNRSYPIMIRTYISKKALTVKLIENRN